MSTTSSTGARVIAVAYSLCVIVAMSVSFFPGSLDGVGLLALLLALPWGLGVVLALDTIDPGLIRSLGPPLVALGGLLNAFLLYNAFRVRK